MAAVHKKNKELVDEDVTHTRDWLNKQRHLPHVSDDMLVMFLHSCRYKRELTKTTIDTYFTMKTATPEFFSQRDPLSEEFQSISKVIEVYPLPEKTPEGYQIIFGRLQDPEPSRYFLDASIKQLFMVVDMVIKEDLTIPGFIFVFDQKGLGFGHLAKLNPISVKKYILYLKEAMPVRLMNIHVMNVSAVTSNIMNIIRPLLTKYQQEQLHLHTPEKIGNLYKMVPQSLLPKEYGGDQPSEELLYETCLKKLQSLRGWFKEDEENRVDESKRCNNMRNSINIFGVEGSFKKLSID